ncbi:RNA recognition motif domain-containing protein [Planctomycetota bacterium]
MNIYVGNLSPETTEDDLRQAFEAFGQIQSIKLLRDRVTGQSNKVGFVGMPDAEEAQTAISTLNGKNLQGSAVKVEEGKRKIDHRSDRDKPDGFGGGRGDRDRRDRFDRSDRGDRGGRGGRRY